MTKLDNFIQAANFWAGSSPDVVRGIIDLAFTDIPEEVDFTDDAVCAKLAATTIAFCQQVNAIARGDFDLDLREEAILEAVVEYVKRRGVDA